MLQCSSISLSSSSYLMPTTRDGVSMSRGIPMPQTPNAADSAETIAETLTSGADQALDAAQDGADQTAQAGEHAARAGFDTAQSAMDATARSTRQGIDSAQASLKRTLDLVGPDGAATTQSVQSVRAISEAGAVMARGAQEASRTWMEMAEEGLRSNLEALNRMAVCRSVQELVELQSDLMRANLNRAIDASEALARSSRSTMEEVNRTFRVQAGGAQAA
jgi:cytosine/adenosine deaminase-related metal-dependent hydrolase